MDRLGVEMRLMTAADAGAVAALHTASWRAAYRGVFSDAWLDADAPANREAHWARRFAAHDERQAGLLLEDADGVAAFAYLIADADPARGTLLDNLHVRPDRRHGGLGRRLMTAAVRLTLLRRWPPGLHLWVFEANDDARRFYARLGGVMVERVHHASADGHDHPALCYHWDAAAAAGLAARQQGTTAAGAP